MDRRQERYIRNQQIALFVIALAIVSLVLFAILGLPRQFAKLLETNNPKAAGFEPRKQFEVE